MFNETLPSIVENDFINNLTENLGMIIENANFTNILNSLLNFVILLKNNVVNLVLLIGFTLPRGFTLPQGLILPWVSTLPRS